MKKSFAVINLIVVLLMIAANYYSTLFGVNGNTVASLSDSYSNYFTPSAYAFSIWGIIFIAQIAGAIVLIKNAWNNGMSEQFISKIALNMVKVNLANVFWIYLWLSEKTLLSVGMMLMLLLYLTITFITLLRAKNTNKILAFSINIYWGWIAVATIANISAWLSKIALFPANVEIGLAVLMILVAGILNAFILFRFKNWVFAAVGIWAIIAIAVRYTSKHTLLLSTCVLALVLIILAGIKAKKQLI